MARQHISGNEKGKGPRARGRSCWKDRGKTLAEWPGDGTTEEGKKLGRWMKVHGILLNNGVFGEDGK